jgi:hypothetical protein
MLPESHIFGESGLRLYKLKIFVFLLLFLSVSYSQTLELYTIGNLQIHTGKPFFTDSPALGNYFDDNFGYGFGLNYRFFYDDSKQLLAGFDYNSSRFNNKTAYSEKFLGKEIIVNSYTPFVGIGKIIQSEYFNFIYAIAGLSIKTYKGRADFEGFDVVYNYDNNFSIRLGSGFETKTIFDSAFSFGARVDADFGPFKRGNVYFYDQGEKIARAVPTGNVNLQDNLFSINLYLIYQFKL